MKIKVAGKEDLEVTVTINRPEIIVDISGNRAFECLLRHDDLHCQAWNKPAFIPTWESTIIISGVYLDFHTLFCDRKNELKIRYGTDLLYFLNGNGETLFINGVESHMAGNLVLERFAFHANPFRFRND